jgi:hypothetical protein
LGVTLTGWPLEVTARTGLPAATVRSLAALSFSFDVPLREVPYRLARRTTVARGLAALSRATPLEAAAVTTTGELEVEAYLAPNVRLQPERLACKRLTLASRPEDLERAALKEPPAKRRVVPASDQVALSRTRGGPATLKVRWADGYLPLERVSQHKGWMRVRARWDDGARLQGYIEAAAASARIGLGRPGGRAQAERSCSRRFGYAYFGPATLQSGKTLHTRAGGPVWATAREPARMVVLGKSGRWIRVMEIEGLRPAEGCFHERAWVLREDLVYP